MADKNGKIKAQIEVTLPSGGRLDMTVDGSKLSSLADLPRYLRDRTQESIEDILRGNVGDDAMRTQVDALATKAMQLESENQALRSELTKLGQQTEASEGRPKRRGRPPKAES